MVDTVIVVDSTSFDDVIVLVTDGNEFWDVVELLVGFEFEVSLVLGEFEEVKFVGAVAVARFVEDGTIVEVNLLVMVVSSGLRLVCVVDTSV